MRLAPLTAAIDEAATSVNPRIDIIAGLRKDQRPRLWRPAKDELHREFRTLGVYVATVAAASGGLVLEATPRERVASILAAANLKAWVAFRFGPVFLRHYKRVASVTLETLQRKGIPISERDKIESRILREAGKRLGLIDINKQTKEVLFKIIDLSRQLGIGPIAAGEMIADMVPKGRYVHAGSSYRAEMIARTEMIHAQRVASIEAYKKAKYKEVEAFDGDSDAICLARNGTRMTFEQAEVEANDTHPGCVLAFAPVA